ncbi:VWA domain-containing protein [Candidatus Dojkabacteria bacterium]|nr:VWA domain-containing protein [Candidatus Dojkabacteria bacterium]
MNKFKILCGLLILAIFASCGSDPRLEITPGVPSQTAASTIDAVDIYVDCSGSMKGYVLFTAQDAITANQAFKIIVPTFANNVLGRFGNEPDIYKIKDSRETKVPLTSFIEDLNSGEIFGGAATELHTIIPKIIAKQQYDSINKVYVLITDGVLSYGPKLVNDDNRMYNISNKNTLQGLLHTALNTDTTLSLTVVKYLSDFNGNFYYTSQERVDYGGQLLANRPFYFLVFGKKELVSTFLSKENLLPPSEGVFTVTNPIELEVGIFKKRRETEKGKTNTLLQVKEKKGIVIASTPWERGKDKVFIVGINKNNIPGNFYSGSSLFDTLKSDDKNVKIEKLANAAVADGVDDNPKIKNPFRAQDFDHFYKITIDKSMFDNALIDKQITIYFEPSLDIAKSHIDIDYGLSDMTELENKTWGFNLITGAIKLANPGRIPQGAKFTLTLNKSNK